MVGERADAGRQPALPPPLWPVRYGVCGRRSLAVGNGAGG